MKKAVVTMFFYCALLSLISSSARAKDSSWLGGTIGPVVKVSQMGNGAITELGGRINATVARHFLVGLGAHGVVGQSKLDIEGTQEEITYGYGGLGLGYRLFPDFIVHLTSYNTLGLGSLELKGRGKKSLAYSIEPELNVEVDALFLMRIGAGLSYRFMFAKDLGVSSSSLFGFGGQVYIEFGWL